MVRISPLSEPEQLDDKICQYLIHLFDTSTTRDVYELLVNSSIYTENVYKIGYNKPIRLHFIVNPDTYKKYQGFLRNLASPIVNKLNNFTHLEYLDIKFYPDLNKFQILNNTFTPIHTAWEEINSDQQSLIRQLKGAKSTIEFQNIGNTSRTIMEKIADHVFDPKKHIAPANIDVSKGKYKNRLHTYIKTELVQEEKWQDYALSVITSTEKAIDLANTLTHDLKANSSLAEFCVIGTLTAISTIKIIHNG